MFQFSPVNSVNHQINQNEKPLDGKKSNVYEEMGLSVSDKIKAEVEAEKSDATNFMTLIIAQLQNQNPLDPQDGAEFLGQLAQFNAVETNQKVLESINNLVAAYESKRIVDATALIGRSVEVQTSNMQLIDDKHVRGIIDIPENVPDLQVTISNNLGEVVRRFSMGEQTAGQLHFTWDGTDDDNVRLPDGNYRVKAQALVGETVEDLFTTIATNVDNVTVNKSTGMVKLNLAAVGEVPLDEVTKISE